MRRQIATLPDAVAELCLVRVGVQARGLRARAYASRLGRAIDRAADAAIAEGAGLLLSERFRFSRGHFGVLQYWRSFDDLDAWSRRPPHAEWWRGALERMRTRGDVGVYHETYLVPRDRVESIYVDCAPAGLAAFGATGEPVGPLTNSRGRVGRPRDTGPPA